MTYNTTVRYYTDGGGNRRPNANAAKDRERQSAGEVQGNAYVMTHTHEPGETPGVFPLQIHEQSGS